MADYYEIVLDGNTDVLRGFVAGYLAASGLDQEVFVASEYHVTSDSMAHQLAEWIGLVADRTHLIVPAKIQDRLERGTGQTRAKLGIRVVETRRVTGARFEFAWKTFSREAADGLRARFAAAPDGVALEGYEVHEEVHEEEKGATAGYAPGHPYEASASGEAQGSPGAVIRWASDLREEPLVELKSIKLEYAD